MAYDSTSTAVDNDKSIIDLAGYVSASCRFEI